MTFGSIYNNFVQDNECEMSSAKRRTLCLCLHEIIRDFLSFLGMYLTHGLVIWQTSNHIPSNGRTALKLRSTFSLLLGGIRYEYASWRPKSQLNNWLFNILFTTTTKKSILLALCERIQQSLVVSSQWDSIAQSVSGFPNHEVVNVALIYICNLAGGWPLTQPNHPFSLGGTCCGLAL